MITQSLLLDSAALRERHVTWDMVQADFWKIADTEYQVCLEVSSNKFLLNMVRDESGIESFEVVAIKGFVELTTKMLALLKKLVNHLREMID